ncbi:MAG: bifunctional phosphopantothenoylcysteine decarboxylase/phosphopantothenate--cysteine ligase CoaBC [Rubricoccaceae bacterium]|nr:bifunctional phosphopantothenoylcysteine decarboxylase/phosphopantothenate--cysteine ligase CoaBC [Rubricoccaceae bacterium]
MPDPRLRGKKLVLGVTGSIAAYKAAELVRLLVKAEAEVQPILTAGAARFIAPLTIATLAKREVLTEVFPEGDPGSSPGQAQGGVWTKHVDLGLWADGLVVAPASANTLARLAHGLCDDMLTATVLSARCPVLVAPAMDHDMWHHPATQANVEALRGHGYTVLDPAHGELASGLVGKGRLPEPEALAAAIADWLGARPGPRAPGGGPLAGRKVLVTAGPTREAIDPVRFLSNGSTGTMGFALAAAAARRGADVTLLAGPVGLATPEGVTREDVVSADDLHRAALQHADADLVIAAAAVADYAPAEPSAHKRKKGDDDLTLRLRRTPDVLAALGERKRDGQTLVGFALETRGPTEGSGPTPEDHARDKLRRKRLDWIVLNHADEAGAGFGTGTNRVILLGADGSRQVLPQAPKVEIAETLLDLLTAEGG